MTNEIPSELEKIQLRVACVDVFLDLEAILAPSRARLVAVKTDAPDGHPSTA
jgi:hypothetical protein